MLSLLIQHKQNTCEKTVPDYTHVSDYAPFYEIDAHWSVDKSSNDVTAAIQERHALLGTRVFNTHLRLDMLPENMGEQGNAAARLIYIMRSPLDTCVSFYHHLSHQVQGGYEGTFDEFFQQWLAGDLPFGSWMDHILSFAAGIAASDETQNESTNRDSRVCNQVSLRDGRTLLLVSYQDMIDYLPQVVEDIQEFLQLDSITAQQRHEMLPTFSFCSMKQHLDKFQPQSVSWKNNFSFLRKGVSGDSLTMLSQEQAQQFCNVVVRRKFRETLNQLLCESRPQVLHRFESLLRK